MKTNARRVSCFVALIAACLLASAPALAGVDALSSATRSVSGGARGNSTGNIVNIGFAVDMDGQNAVSDDLTKQFLNWYDGCLYYVDQNDAGRLYRLTVADSESERLSKSKDTAYVNVVDDAIFFVDVSDRYAVCRMDLDGRNREKLCDMRASRLCAADGWLYFANWDKGTTGLWRMDYDGGNRERLYKNDVPLFVNVADGYAYWASNERGSCLARTDVDTGETVFCPDVKGATSLNVYESLLFFVWDGPEGYGVYASEPDLTRVYPVYMAARSEKAIDCLSFANGTMYYRVGGGKESNKTDGEIRSVELYD